MSAATATRPRMSAEEIEARARRRAIDEKLHSWAVETHHLYLVKSRSTAGEHHMVRIVGTDQTARVLCDCRGFNYRESCTHVEVVKRRGEREGWLPKAGL